MRISWAVPLSPLMSAEKPSPLDRTIAAAPCIPFGSNARDGSANPMVAAALGGR
jgi:hypothetical protein